MTLEEAIKHCEEVAETNERICATELSVGLPDIYNHKDEAKKCADEHKQLAEWLKELKQLREQTRWIPVSERLPENRNQEVLISLEWGIDIGRYSDGEWHSEWINHYDDGNVLAWMPLPEPYKVKLVGKDINIPTKTGTESEVQE